MFRRFLGLFVISLKILKVVFLTLPAPLLSPVLCYQQPAVHAPGVHDLINKVLMNLSQSVFAQGSTSL